MVITMVDLTVLCNDEFNVLEKLKYNEQYDEKNHCVYSKCSQDELAESTDRKSRIKIKDYIDQLIDNGYITHYSQNAKYQVTSLGNEVYHDLTEGRNQIKASHYNCISLFAGVGGIDLGFKKAGFPTVYANEFDGHAVTTYQENFNLQVDHRDIHEMVKDLESGKDPFNGQTFDILLAGFPCQAFSIAGYREGFEDKKGRGGLFFEIMKIVKIKKPQVVFLENVKNLVGHDHGKTFTIITDALKSQGYHIQYKVLNSMEYGNVPQNRERIYIVAFLDEEKSKEFHFPFPVPLTNTLEDVLDFHSQMAPNLYYTPATFSHYDEIKDIINKQDTVYQWRRVYVRENKSGVCPTLTANMGTGGHNVPLIYTDHGIRKLTPRECFLLQGYPKDYKLPPLANSHLYKQAGNSVSVTVIERIAKEILRVL